MRLCSSFKAQRTALQSQLSKEKQYIEVKHTVPTHAMHAHAPPATHTTRFVHHTTTHYSQLTQKKAHELDAQIRQCAWEQEEDRRLVENGIQEIDHLRHPFPSYTSSFSSSFSTSTSTKKTEEEKRKAKEAEEVVQMLVWRNKLREVAQSAIRNIQTNKSRCV
jgi:hypothetical protein